MRDYTNKVGTSTGDIPIKFTMQKYDGSYKLYLIKAIKDVTKMGLKESKDFVDRLPSTFYRTLTIEELTSFKRALSDVSSNILENEVFIYSLDDIVVDRHRKLLSMGMGSRSDILEDLKIINDNNRYVDNSINIVEEFSKYINDDQLLEVYNKVLEHYQKHPNISDVNETEKEIFNFDF